MWIVQLEEQVQRDRGNVKIFRRVNTEVRLFSVYYFYSNEVAHSFTLFAQINKQIHTHTTTDGQYCESNTYSEGGAAECTECSSGKYSNVGASQCIECDFMYRLSTHCDVPVAGLLLVGSMIIVIAVTSILFQRYRRKQERIKERLRVDLYRQRQLVKTKQTDITLLMSAWNLSPKEVKFEKRIAGGAYGEVWRGALHNRFLVAIKKLHASGSKSSASLMSSSRSCNKSYSHSSMRSLSSTSPSNKKKSKSVFEDKEVRFLIRTSCDF